MPKVPELIVVLGKPICDLKTNVDIKLENGEQINAISTALLHNKDVKTLVSKKNHTVLVTEDDEVFAWGVNKNGELGIGTKEVSDKVELVTSFHKNKLKSISIGHNYSIAITENSEVWVWGGNEYCQLGFSDTKDRTVPKFCTFFTQIKVKAIASGSFHNIVLAEDGKVYSWGLNDHGQAGHHGEKIIDLPRMLVSLQKKRIVNIFAGDEFSLALTDNHDLFAWGRNDKGQLGNGTYDSSDTPQLVQLPKKKKVKKIVVSSCHVFLITDDGSLYGWGDNSCGQLGIPGKQNVHTVHPIFGFGVKRIRNLYTSSTHTIIITEKNETYGWGSNEFGELGTHLLDKTISEKKYDSPIILPIHELFTLKTLSVGVHCSYIVTNGMRRNMEVVEEIIETETVEEIATSSKEQTISTPTKAENIAKKLDFNGLSSPLSFHSSRLSSRLATPTTSRVVKQEKEGTVEIISNVKEIINGQYKDEIRTETITTNSDTAQTSVLSQSHSRVYLDEMAGKSLYEIYHHFCTKYKCTENSEVAHLLKNDAEKFCVNGVIDMNKNLLGDRGVIPLIEVVRRVPQCTTLLLKKHSIRNSGTKMIMAMAREHASLSHIDLSENPVALSGANAIADAIKKNHKLKEICLKNTRIQKEFLYRIESLLEINRKRSK